MEATHGYERDMTVFRAAVIIASLLVAVRAQSTGNAGHSSATADSNFYDYSGSFINGKYYGERDDNWAAGSNGYFGFSGESGASKGIRGGTAEKPYSPIDDGFRGGTFAVGEFTANSPTDGFDATAAAAAAAARTKDNGNPRESSYLMDGRAAYAGFSGSVDKKEAELDGYRAGNSAARTGGNANPNLHLGPQYAMSEEYGREAGNEAGQASFDDYSVGAASTVPAASTASGSSFARAISQSGQSSASFAPLGGQSSSSISQSLFASPYSSGLLSSDYSFGKHGGKYESNGSPKYGSEAFSSLPESYYAQGHRGSAFSGRAPSSLSSGYSSEANLVGDSFLSKLRGGGGIKHGKSPGSYVVNYLSKDHGPNHPAASYLRGHGKMVVTKRSRPNVPPTYTSLPVRSLAIGSGHGPSSTSYKVKGPSPPFGGYASTMFQSYSSNNPMENRFPGGNLRSNGWHGSFSGYS